MKKKLIVLLILAFTLIVSSIGLVACGEQSETAEDYKTTEIYAVYKLYAASEEGKGNSPLSYEQWLLMIKGEKGEKGEQGEKGEKGDQGERGADGTNGENGTNGKSAYEIWLDNGHTGTESDFLEWLKTDEENPQGLDFYPLPDGTFGVGAGKALYLETVVIPTTYKNKSVTKIVDWAFAVDERTANKSLTSITIPDSVTSIGENAFYDCRSLTSITIPDSVTSIGENAFYDCGCLIEVINKSQLNIVKGSDDNGDVAYYAITVHNGESKIANKNGYTFINDNGTNYLCNYRGSETELVLPSDYNGEPYEIYNYAFFGCSSLTSVTIGNSVTSIGDYAFYGCSSLTSITIGGSVTSIGEWAFEGCSSLTSVTIGNSVTSIGSCAFYDCSNLTSISIPDSVTSIGSDAFYNCRSLTSVTIGNSVTSIGEWAFAACRSLTSITIPDSVTSIGGFAFSGCSGLTSITIPDSVTIIGGGGVLWL